MAAITVSPFNDAKLDAQFASIFGDFHSEATRQELIGKKADSLAQDLTKTLLTNEDNAITVADDILGFATPEEIAVLLRCAFRGDSTNLRLELLALTMKSVQRVAENRAIKEVEAVAPTLPIVSCSQCGGTFGRGKHGFSSCADHKLLKNRVR